MQAQMARGAATYQEVQITSRSPLELVVMLYDGAIGALALARDAMLRHDLQAKRTAMSKSLAIIHELQSTLNMESGGDVAGKLDDLYTYLTSRLVEANIRCETAPLDEATRLLSMLREAWHAIASARVGGDS